MLQRWRRPCPAWLAIVATLAQLVGLVVSIARAAGRARSVAALVAASAEVAVAAVVAVETALADQRVWHRRPELARPVVVAVRHFAAAGLVATLFAAAAVLVDLFATADIAAVPAPIPESIAATAFGPVAAVFARPIRLVVAAGTTSIAAGWR